LDVKNSCVKKCPKGKRDNALCIHFTPRIPTYINRVEIKKYMLDYLTSKAHLKAMKKFSKIGDGKVYGYEADVIPNWEDALAEWDKNGRMH
tara:strand:+ start:70 stop:342 length:273 start_codon:yes stop_codon:yes gene_type:complete